MKPQSWEKLLLTGIALATLISEACMQPPTEAEKYVREVSLPRQLQAAVRELEYDKNNPNDYTKLFLDKLYYLPKELQTHQVTLDYLKDVAEDKKVSVEEYSILLNDKLDHDRDGLDLATENKLKTDPLKPNPEVKQAIDYLKSISESTLGSYMKLGLDGDALLNYMTFVSTLPKDFADYAIKQKLCIQGKKLTELGEQFLKDPNKYAQQMFDYYMSEINKIDPELADKLKMIPFLKEVELGDVEAIEDVLYLAMQPEGKAALEKIYGKGIERKMWPVALEKLIWDSYNSELEINDLRIHLRLADFHAKYNKEMDMEGGAGPKPGIRGMNYINEPQHWLDKSEDDYRFDYALMRWGLRCNAVRLWGYDDYAFDHVKMAQNEGLEVYLQFEPVVPRELGNIHFNLDSYKNELSNFARKAEKHNIKVLYIGNELELWWKEFGSKGAWGWTFTSFDSRQSGKVQKFLEDIVKLTRKNYSGLVTYADWWASRWGFNELDWSSMDIVSRNMIMQDTDDNFFLNYLITMKNKYTKTLIISEIGSLTIREAEQAGGDDSYLWRFPVHHDKEKQAQVIDRRLKLAFQAGVDGVFIFCWDRSGYKGVDMNIFGFGIWDYVKEEPKLSFWTVYKYYKE